MDNTPYNASDTIFKPEVASHSVSRYFHSMEQRVKALEAQVARLTGSTALPTDEMTGALHGTWKSPYSTTSTMAIPEVLRLSRNEFESLNSDSKEIYAIELLVRDGAVLKIRIRSEQLVRVLGDVMGPDLAPDPFKSTVMVRPFRSLMRCNSLLTEKRTSLIQEFSNSEGKSKEPIAADRFDIAAKKEYLDLLFRAFEVDLFDDFNAYTALTERTAETVSFLHLAFLFRTGDVIVERDGESTQAYLIQNVYESNIQSRQNPAQKLLEDINGAFVLDCFSIGFDGKVFGPVQKAFTILSFVGAKKITNLPVVPIRYLGGDELKAKLIQRGRIFWSLRNPSHKSYSGMSLDYISEEIDGQVVIDFELYYRQNPGSAPTIGLLDYTASNEGGLHTDAYATCYIPGCNCPELVQNTSVYDESKADRYLMEAFLKSNSECLEVSYFKEDTDPDRLSEVQLMLLPNSVWAFHLRGRKWHPLDINRVQDIMYAGDAFDYLVLPAGHKKMLASLVSMNVSKSQMKGDSTNDMDRRIRKEKGLVILLHGGPGVGKTSTAECLADSVQKPLLSIAAADIGETAYQVEEYLERFFTLSRRWGCVLLFDEADIILQARDRANMQRNAIVSVFLRTFEYYSGILLLTTNRVGIIDEAFKSRIHINLLFPALDRDSCMKIWEMSLHRLKAQDTIKIDMFSIMEFIRYYLERSTGGDHKLPNGRDIRNTLQSAVALAEYEHKEYDYGDDIKPKLTENHLKRILGTSTAFDKYMVAVHGGSDDVQAKRMGERNDDYWDKPKYVSRAAAKPLYTTSRYTEKLGEADSGDGF